MRGGLFNEILRMSWETVRGNKMRSFLTVLGIVIGITSIVGMTSLIRGFDENFKNSIKSIGPDVVYISKFSGLSFANGKSFQELMKRPNLTPEDAAAIERDAPSIQVVDIVLGQGGTQERVYYRSERTKPLITLGTTERYVRLANIDLEVGRYFTAPEVQHARIPGAASVAGRMLDHLRDLNADAAPHGSFGAVVGATIAEPAPEDGVDLDFGGPILAPGFGAQGGTVADLRRIFGSASARVLPSSSREILAAGPDQQALRDAVARTTESLAGLS